MPRHLLEVVAASPVPLAEQGFREAVFETGQIAWSDDVTHDPRFVFPLFRVLKVLHLHRRLPATRNEPQPSRG